MQFHARLWGRRRSNLLHFINRSLPSAELLNFGTGAYGSYQSRLRVSRYFNSPHKNTPLVIYGLFYSHHFRDLAPLPWIFSLTMQDGSYMVPPNVRFRSGQIVESAGGPIGLWPLEGRSAARYTRASWTDNALPTA